MAIQSTIMLNNGTVIPQVGLGVFQTPDGDTTVNAVQTALENGYRHIDTAMIYRNEASVGEGIRRAGVPRSDFFLTTKLWNDDIRARRGKDAFQESLDRLGVDYVDLYLIHWPVPGCFLNTWKDMEKILESGRALSIGVSNFEIRHLEELRRVSGIVPAVNQIECHPLCYPKELIEYCQANDIQVQAYAPLARGAYLDNDVLCVLGTKYAHTPAQIGLRWAVQKGISVIPKSVHPERIASNARIFDFTIDQEDMDLLDTLNQNYHSSSIPEDLRDIVF